jgi:uncharacterized RDD family membrane protein YckC/Tfp pilus assembly major pilin PilA
MYCPNCGTAVSESQRFCANCGTSLQTAKQAPISVFDSPPSPSIAAVEPPYAGFWRRAWAWLIDYVVFTLVFYVLALIIGAAGVALVGKSAGIGVREIAIVGFLVFPWLYYAGMESSVIQATVGKLVAGIKVTDLSGKRVTFARATGRYFAHILSGLTLGVGYAMVVFSSHRQALHDMVAGTLVVRKRFPQDYIATAGLAPRVSPWLATVAVVGVLLFGPFGIGILAAIAIPAYQDYMVRAQVAEGLGLAAPYQAAVVEAVAQGQSLASLTTEQLQLPETGQWRYVDSIRVVSGIVVVTYGAANNLIAGKSVLLIPGTDDRGAIVWTCGHSKLAPGITPVTTKNLGEYTTVANKYLPLACK